jgi:hypothetical protein
MIFTSARKSGVYPISHISFVGKLDGVALSAGAPAIAPGFTSALNVNCKTHDLDNLYVVDDSFFVSSAAVNPALPLLANALRGGDHLLERMK